MTPPSDSMTICRDSIFRRNVSSFICSSTLLFLSFTIKKRTHIHGCAGRQSKEAYRSGTTPAGISTVSCDLLLRLQRASPSTSLDKNVIFHNSTNPVLNCQHNSEFIIQKKRLTPNWYKTSVAYFFANKSAVFNAIRTALRFNVPC